MNEERRKKILEWIDAKLGWPSWASDEDKKELMRTGFVHGQGGKPLPFLTSLGELEIGYPETGEAGDKTADHSAQNRKTTT